MTDKREDPAGTTHQFRAFVSGAPADPDSGSRTPLLIALGIGAAALVVVLAIAFVL